MSIWSYLYIRGTQKSFLSTNGEPKLPCLLVYWQFLPANFPDHINDPTKSTLRLWSIMIVANNKPCIADRDQCHSSRILLLKRFIWLIVTNRLVYCSTTYIQPFSDITLLMEAFFCSICKKWYRFLSWPYWGKWTSFARRIQESWYIELTWSCHHPLPPYFFGCCNTLKCKWTTQQWNWS